MDDKGLGMTIDEEKIPVKQGVHAACELLGINVYELACEGRIICVADRIHAPEVVKQLKKFNDDAAVIGVISDTGGVVLQTRLGSRILPVPTGRIVPRIC